MKKTSTTRLRARAPKATALKLAPSEPNSLATTIRENPYPFIAGGVVVGVGLGVVLGSRVSRWAAVLGAGYGLLRLAQSKTGSDFSAQFLDQAKRVIAEKS